MPCWQGIGTTLTLVAFAAQNLNACVARGISVLLMYCEQLVVLMTFSIAA
jgi:hypothetical protein